MNIRCPECGQDHDVPETRIPADRFKANCRGCRASFVVSVIRCKDCGQFLQKGQGCQQCPQAADLLPEETVEVPRYDQLHEVAQVQATRKKSPRSSTVQFSGRGGAFFRIWIVNLFLTLMTLGIYTPWAKVRTRQYFYTHTTIDGESFEYLADPMILLRGYIVIAVGFFIYSASQMMPIINGIIFLIFYGLFPLLVFKSLRFYGHNSSFRNIRFAFLGSVNGAYLTYLLLPIAIPFTLGLIIPYWVYYKKKYFFENFALGGVRNIFTAQAKPFYLIYLKSLLMMLVPVIGLGVMAAVILPQVSQYTGGGDSSATTTMFIGFSLAALAYLGFFMVAILAQQYVYAKTMNYCWEQSQFGSVRFESTLSAVKLMKIQLVNILAIVFSFGLLFPWAKIRKTRYILENLTLKTTGGFDDFKARDAVHETALGEAAMDFFDFEIGL